MQAKIPARITFSPVKHHLYFLHLEILKWKHLPWPEVQEEMLQIGNNLIDFYTGTPTVEQICNEVLEFFNRKNILSRDAFLKWLEDYEWKKIRLSDGSDWLIKKGNDPERYIHIHPAKYSDHSIRIRATTLKTVLALQVQGIHPQNQLRTDLEAVNMVRKNLLNLSPIKSLHSADSGILRLWLLFEKTSF